MKPLLTFTLYLGQQYKGIVQCLKKSVASEGYGCLFRGVGSTVIRAFPTNAATMGVVTWIMKSFAEEEVSTRNNSRILIPARNHVIYPGGIPIFLPKGLISTETNWNNQRGFFHLEYGLTEIIYASIFFSNS